MMKTPQFLNFSLWLQRLFTYGRQWSYWRLSLHRFSATWRPGMQPRLLLAGAVVQARLHLPTGSGASAQRQLPWQAPSRLFASALRVLRLAVGCGMTAGSRLHGPRLPGSLQDTVVAAYEQRCVGGHSRGTAACCYCLSREGSRRHASRKSRLGSDSQKSRAQEELSGNVESWRPSPFARLARCPGPACRRSLDSTLEQPSSSQRQVEGCEARVRWYLCRSNCATLPYLSRASAAQNSFSQDPKYLCRLSSL